MSTTDLAAFLIEQRRRLAEDAGGGFIELHEEFVRALGTFVSAWREPAATALVDRHARFFRGCQRRYLHAREREASTRALARPPNPSGLAESRLPTDFAVASYDRVRGLATLVDFERCTRAIVIGCGAFPATLLWLRDRHGLAGVGIDAEATCVTQATRLTTTLGRGDLVLTCADGCVVDYAGFDLVYVTNQVTPKAAVVARVAATARPGTQLVVRDPYGPGVLLAEAVRDALPVGVSVLGEGERSPTFLSCDVALRLNDRR